MILGTAEQIQEKIDLALQLVKEEKNNDVRLALYNYIGNLYSALSTIKGRKVYPNKDKIFGGIDNYKRFMKKTDFLYDIYDDNFIRHKLFHREYFHQLLLETEGLFVDMVNENVDYREGDDTFTEDDFLTVFHDFLKSLGIEKLFDEILENNRIYSMNKGRNFEQYNGMTLYNPVTGESDILLNGFNYNVDSMFTLAHEMGHVYDGFRIFDDKDSERFLHYNFRSTYLEVILRLFERLFLDYLIKNNICREAALDKMVDMEINNHDYLVSAYTMSLLDDELLKYDRYHSLKPREIVSYVKDYFNDLETIKRLFSDKYIRLDEEVNYTYGDIMSMFLKDGVQAEGFSNLEFKEFLRTRIDDFNPEFIETHGFTPERYREKYIRDMKVLRKVIL